MKQTHPNQTDPSHPPSIVPNLRGTCTGRNGKFTCLYEKNKDHLKNQKIFNFTIKDSYIT